MDLSMLGPVTVTLSETVSLSCRITRWALQDLHAGSALLSQSVGGRSVWVM